MENDRDTRSAVERWLPVLGYEGIYEVSDQGRVRSLERMVRSDLHKNGMRRIPPRILTQTPMASGYLSVKLSRDNRGRTGKVATLAAEAFIGPRPATMDVCHGDGVRTNNVLTNLRYDTRKANMADAARHGTIRFGERSGVVKLSDAEVVQIRSLSASSLSRQEIGRLFGVTRTHISYIMEGKTRKVMTDGKR